MSKLVKASKVTFKLFNQVDQKDELEMEGLFDRADKAVKQARQELPSGTVSIPKRPTEVSERIQAGIRDVMEETQ